ncbi:amidase [Lysinibacillus cavernae]|uniref:amidase n=1 Tax=Lysinibacillus cavernae TaxID=2666135 RepID=UPI0012D93286|nr:amidase [Lysinibacillus cavernae]
MKKQLVVKVWTALVVIIVNTFGLWSGKVDAMEVEDKATWLWDTSIILEDQEKILLFLENNHVNKVYLQINQDIASNAYRHFISKATEKGIRIFALDGAASWVSADSIQSQDEFFHWLHTYNENSALSEQFSGIHLDVEPYLNSGWSLHQAQTIESYQALMVKAREKATQLQLSLEVDLPFWFDEIRYNNQFGKGLLADWVIDQVDSVTIMAYRDAAKDIISIVEHEIAYATTVDKSIVIGVETGASEEGRNITFYDNGEAYMNKQLTLVQQHYNKYTAFQGIAIHYVENWMKMRP